MVRLCCLSVSLVIVFYVLNNVVSVEAQSQQFRKDYKYLPETQSFYKIHTIHRTWKDAKKRCALEGATLFYPVDQEEANAVISLWNSTQPSIYWIYIAVSDLLSRHVFETIDGTPIDDVYNHWSLGEPNDKDGDEDCVVLNRHGKLNDDTCQKKFSFICKKRQDTIQWNVLCDMPNPSYLYNAQLGKCYKFHLSPLNWTTAYGVCAAEQSYLAVVNSDKEAEYLVQLTADAAKDNVSGNYMRGVVALGFHNRDQEGWKTSKGTSLEEAGYAKWGNQQPDGNANELCGTMFYNGLLNDLNCDLATFFICEHDISSLSSAIDERLNSAT